MSIEVRKEQEETGLVSTMSFDMTVPEMTFNDNTAIVIKDKKKTALAKKKKAALAKKKKEALAKKKPRFFYEILAETYEESYFNKWHSSKGDVREKGKDAYSCPLLTVGSYLNLTPYVKDSYSAIGHKYLFESKGYNRLCMDHGWLGKEISNHELVKCIKTSLTCPRCGDKEMNEPEMAFHYASAHNSSNKKVAEWLKAEFYDKKPQQLEEKQKPMLDDSIWSTPQIVNMNAPFLTSRRTITMPKLELKWTVDENGNVQLK